MRCKVKVERNISVSTGAKGKLGEKSRLNVGVISQVQYNIMKWSDFTILYASRVIINILYLM